MIVSLLAAVAENGVIGAGGGLPWHLPDDLARFKTLTWGKPMLMGRRTFDSIGRPLPGRTSLVLTRSAGWTSPGVAVVHSLGEALACAGNVPELVVIGGAEVYRLALPAAQRLYLTRIHASVAGDTRFPAFDSSVWRETASEPHPADGRHPYPMTFSVLERG